MIYQIFYTRKAVDELNRLPKSIARRIDKKLEYYSQQSNPLQFAQRLTNPAFGTFRFRIGDYRVIFDIDAQGNITILVILSVKHRKEVYRF